MRCFGDEVDATDSQQGFQSIFTDENRIGLIPVTGSSIHQVSFR
jgi:hypothetical protein